jgi:hypothetical protein
MATVFSDQNLPFTLVITKADGTPATVHPGSIVYATSDATVITVTAAADGLSGTVSPVADGTARMTITANADLGAGVVAITGVSEDIVVSTDPASLAAHFAFTFGAAVPKPAPGP